MDGSGSVTVKLSRLIFTIPVGSLGVDLTEETVIEVPPPVGWEKGSEPLTFVPTSATSLFELEPGHTIAFGFKDITMNQAVGTATLTVYECGKDQEFPACPSYDLDIAKYPPGANVGNISLWIDPPPARPAGTPVTVHWKGPQGPTYTLYQDADRVGRGPVENEGQHAFTLKKGTWFTLEIAMAVGKDSAHATVQLHVLVTRVPIAIEEVKGTIDRDKRSIDLYWKTNKTDGQCTFDDVDPSYPLNGRRRGIPCSDRWDGVTMTAKDFHSGTSVSVLIKLRWETLNKFEPQVYRPDTGWSSLGKSSWGQLQLALSRPRKQLLWAQHSTVGTCALPASAATPLKQEATFLIDKPSLQSSGVYGLAPILLHKRANYVVAQLRKDDGGLGLAAVVPGDQIAPLPCEPGLYLSRDGRAFVASTGNDPVLFQATSETGIDLFELEEAYHQGYWYMHHRRIITVAHQISAVANAPDGKCLYIAHGTSLSILDPSSAPKADRSPETQNYKFDSIAAVHGIAISVAAIFVATPAGIRVFDRDVKGIPSGGNLKEIGHDIPFVARDLVVTDDGLTIYAVDQTGREIATIVPTGVTTAR